jgi:hypothetical protein
LQILTTMVQQYLEVLYDPESFFERGEEAESILGPVLALGFVGLTSALTAWLNTQRTAEMLSRMGDGAGGAQGFAALTGTISVVFALVFPFLGWLIYGALFHGISGLLDGEGEFVTTVVYTGWGFVPNFLGATVALAANYVILQAVSLPSEVTPQTMQAYQQQVQSHPASLVVLVVGLGILLWNAYIWVAAVEHARDVDRTDAMIAVGFPVAVVVLIRLGTRFLL